MSATAPIPQVCLTDAELEHLVDSPLPSLQMKWLDERGWQYEVSRRGRPRVARTYAEQRLGVTPAANDAQAHTTAPDWSHDG